MCTRPLLHSVPNTPAAALNSLPNSRCCSTKLNAKQPLLQHYTIPTALCGGYVISPLNQHKQSIVRHWLAIDWKSWRPYLQKSSAPSLTIRMLERIVDFQNKRCRMVNASSDSDHLNLINMDDQSDEFFDFSEPLYDEETEDSWDVDNSPEKKHEFMANGLGLKSQNRDFVEFGCKDDGFYSFQCCGTRVEGKMDIAVDRRPTKRLGRENGEVISKQYELVLRNKGKAGLKVQRSVKNFQLTMEKNGRQTILLLGRVGKSMYVLDYM
ncbi:protein enhanced disease resistance 2 [Tanacetum coccineum]